MVDEKMMLGNGDIDTIWPLANDQFVYANRQAVEKLQFGLQTTHELHIMEQCQLCVHFWPPSSKKLFGTISFCFFISMGKVGSYCLFSLILPMVRLFFIFIYIYIYIVIL